MAKFAWLIVFAFGIGLGAALMWLRQGDLIGNLSKALNKCNREKQELLANIAALDDELDDAETLIHDAVVFCDCCCDPVRAGTRYNAEYEWPEHGKPAQVVVTCGRCADEDRETLTFAAVDA